MTEITQALLDDLRAGKSEAYEQLYNQYYESVYTLTYGILQNYDDAQDAVQQTFIHVFRKLSTLKSDGSFSLWLMKIANNEALMILRKRKRTPVPDEDIELQVPEQSIDEPTLPATMAERRDTAEQLRRMIEKLPYEQRETLVLYYYHQQKITEIAAIMGCSESTTKSRLRYARASVKKEVEQWEKKNGEKFRGVAMAPFGKVFVELLQKDAKQKRRRERTWKVILPAIYTTSGSAGYAAGVFTTASSSLIVKIAAGMAACVIAVTGIAGIASGGGNGEEKGGSFYGGSGQAQGQQQEAAQNQNLNREEISNSVQSVSSQKPVTEPPQSETEESDILSEQERELFDEINNMRIEVGLPLFTISGFLCDHAQDGVIYNSRSLQSGPVPDDGWNEDELTKRYIQTQTDLDMNEGRDVSYFYLNAPTAQDAAAKFWEEYNLPDYDEYVEMNGREQYEKRFNRSGEVGIAHLPESTLWVVILDQGYKQDLYDNGIIG
jgi:RNA polymerase sigma-70 factor (ECF subfamily)